MEEAVRLVGFILSRRERESSELLPRSQAECVCVSIPCIRVQMCIREAPRASGETATTTATCFRSVGFFIAITDLVQLAAL